ncbi:hypothetical protein H5410_000316 [Solanum commersonii]|uniref:Uncharacterized protein n=1 Tax=Solanum commersonii TaxID=4109 RepID=A0A9J6AWV0_SOLCO|nr:hypothetical protein H5410_000316 [Solanum commersonii]
MNDNETVLREDSGLLKCNSPKHKTLKAQSAHRPKPAKQKKIRIGHKVESRTDYINATKLVCLVCSIYISSNILKNIDTDRVKLDFFTINLTSF